MAQRSELVERLTRELMAQGKIIEAGWMSYRMVVLPGNASEVQIDETRKAFFAGCQHLFASMMTALDPGTEPTADDLARMDKIHAELDEFGAGLMAEVAARRRG